LSLIDRQFADPRPALNRQVTNSGRMRLRPGPQIDRVYGADSRDVVVLAEEEQVAPAATGMAGFAEQEITVEVIDSGSQCGVWCQRSQIADGHAIYSYRPNGNVAAILANSANIQQTLSGNGASWR
jgi:hypothetical protein